MVFFFSRTNQSIRVDDNKNNSAVIVCCWREIKKEEK